MSGRKDFLHQAAPENYVAGLGRGATGFTTRSDLGPARQGPSEDQIKEALAKRAAALGAPTPTAYGALERKDDAEDDDSRFQDAENDTGLFANGTYDWEDDEADRIYQEVDEKMEKRRRARVEAREQREREEYERNNPKIQQQFADLKRALGSVTDDEWANIPEVGDLTGRNRRNKQNMRQRFYAVPDSVIVGARDATQFEATIADDGMASAIPGGDSVDGTATNFADIGAARDKVLKVRLDQAATNGTDTTSGTSTTIDPKGYLTSLSKSEVRTGEHQVGDIKRTRALLESVIKTNPKHGPAWIAIARFENEICNKVVTARNYIMKGCEHCPKSEDVWIEAINMHENHNAKIIASNALKINGTSVRLWKRAIELENDARSRKRVARQALDHIPQSVAMWREAVNLEENPNDAKLLLAKATELIPLSVELWLALARLETPKNAQLVLNKARKECPTSYEIWIAAARLQEQLEEYSMISIIMERAIKSLARESSMLKREEWIAEAEKCEAEGAIHTCVAIIENTLGWGLHEDDDRQSIWMDDARSSIGRGHYGTARAIFAYLLRVFTERKEAWFAAAELEKAHGSQESLWALMEKATAACPNSVELWLLFARDKLERGDIVGARAVLAKGFVANNKEENIYLEAVSLEFDLERTEEARKMLSQGRTHANTDRIWIKSVAFERIMADPEAALDLANQGLQIYPTTPKLWMQKGQIYEGLNKFPQAREAYNTGLRACPKSVPLYLLASRLDEKSGVIVKARSVLDRGRLAVPKNDVLWCESVRLERRAGNIAAANSIMAQALKEIPTSGLLWTERIMRLEARTQRRPRALDAIKSVDGDPLLFSTVARIFWSERKLEKAATWFEKAIVADPDIGDVWAWYLKFLMQHGKREKLEDVRARCAVSAPRHGEIWQVVAKDPKNARMSVDDILKQVVERLE